MDADSKTKTKSQKDVKPKESKGERFLELMGLPKDYVVREFFDDHPKIGALMRTPAAKLQLQQFHITEDSKCAKVLDYIFKRTKREDFIFTREYTVKNHFQQTRGKWPSAIANSVFLDCKKFHIVYSELFFKRLYKKLNDEVYAKKMSFAQYNVAHVAIEGSRFFIKESDFSEYAVQSTIKGKDSQKQYVEDPYWPQRASYRLMAENRFRHMIENDFRLETALSQSMVRSASATMMYKNFVMLIFLIMIFLAFIVSNSLIQTSIEQRQYESAMLRILGWNNKYIIIVTIMKSILFYIIPGAVIGLFLSY